VSDYQKEIDKFRKIIKRFDEVMLDKASKFSVDNLWDELKEYVSREELDSITDTYEQEKRNLRNLARELTEDVSCLFWEIWFYSCAMLKVTETKPPCFRYKRLQRSLKIRS
jgi:hypothetical protein